MLAVRQHRRMLSGTVLWCAKCGVYADKKAKGLKKVCKGKPPKHKHRGGMEGQLMKLRNNTHPKTGAELPAAIELDKPIVTPRDAKSDVAHVAPGGFYEYVPTTSTVASSPIVVNGMSSEERRAAFHESING